MNDSIIKHHINRTNRNVLITIILVSIGSGLIILAFAPFLIALIISVVGIIIGIIVYTTKNGSNPEEHSIVKSISSRYKDYSRVLNQIDQEANLNPIKYGNTLFTTNWVLQPSLYGLSVTNRAELVWAYLKKTVHSVNFIPVNTTNSVILCSFKQKENCELLNMYKNEIVITGDKNAKKLLNFISQYSPWAIVGYTDEIDRLWSKRTSEILSVVINKRNSYYQR